MLIGSVATMTTTRPGAGGAASLVDPAAIADQVAAAEAADFREWCVAFRNFLARLSPERRAELRRRILGVGRGGPRRVRIVPERPLRDSA